VKNSDYAKGFYSVAMEFTVVLQFNKINVELNRWYGIKKNLNKYGNTFEPRLSKEI